MLYSHYSYLLSCGCCHCQVHLSLNRFDAHNSEDSFEFLVQQALSANPMGFNANLVVEFMDEPGGGFRA